MAPLAKRPRHSDDHGPANTAAASQGGFYDNVPGTMLTRTSASSSMPAPAHAAYVSVHAPNGAPPVSMGAPASPLLASHLSPAGTGMRSLAPPTASPLAPGTAHPHSSGAEDNEDMVAPKSSSTQGTRGRGRGRGRGRPRGSGRGRGSARTIEPADVSQSFSDSRAYAHTNGVDAPNDDADPVAEPLVFQCRKCFRLLGDSFAFVATDTELGYVVLSDVSEVIAQDSAFQTSTEPGKDMGATFASLRCAGCQAVVGRTYTTTPRHLDDLRDCASLDVDAISTYQLGSNATRNLEPPSPARPEEQPVQKPSSRDRALEDKMEKTRALTIELSDRLIRAEQDIRNYAQLVDRLLAANAANAANAPAGQTSAPAESAAPVQERESRPEQRETHEQTATPPPAAAIVYDHEQPATPPGPQPKLESESESRGSYKPSARATRSSRPSLVVFVENTTNTSQI